MNLSSRDISHWEHCDRLPRLRVDFEPIRLSLREAVRRILDGAILSLLANHAESVASHAEATLLDWAASPGIRYPYPSGDAYKMARDYGAWLYGIVCLLAERMTVADAQPLPVLRIHEHKITVSGILDSSGTAHLARITSDFSERSTATRWPELCLLALASSGPPIVSVVTHCFRLPSNSSGRMMSPLSVGYQHPTIGTQIRLARIGEDKGSSFSSSWRRVGRWEVPEVGWEEWRRGIDLDQCIDSCVESHEAVPLSDAESADMRSNVYQIVEWMNGRASQCPRKREACRSCDYRKFCHGNPSEREEEYVRACDSVCHWHNDENMPKVQNAEAAGAVLP